MKSIKYECLNHFILLGQRHLRHVVAEFVAHYHEERYHQGLGGVLILARSAANSDKMAGPIHRKTRLGGLLSCYYREVA